MELIDKVRDVMVKKVVTASPDTRLSEVAKLIERKRVGSVVVVEDDKVAGIITKRDFLRLVASSREIMSSKAKDYMSKNVVTCSPAVTVADALTVMRKSKVRHLPVVNEDRTLMGIVSLRDLVAATQLASLYMI